MEMYESNTSPNVRVEFEVEKNRFEDVLKSKAWNTVEKDLGDCVKNKTVKNVSALELETSMWKHTAKVYEQRYENMRAMLNVCTVVSTGTGLLAVVLGLILLVR